MGERIKRVFVRLKDEGLRSKTDEESEPEALHYVCSVY
jgi:hypothetical protein